MDRDEIIVTYGENIRDMVFSVLNAAKIEKDISHNAVVALKPNLVVAKPSASGATTSPDIVGAIIEYLHKRDIPNIIIIEGSWVRDSTARAYDACGYNDISVKYNVPLYDLKEDSYSVRKAGGLDLKICNLALNCDYLINIPVLKGHCQTLLTCALKNMKGCIPDSEKRRYHTMGLHKPIAALNAAKCADFVLVDGMCGDLDFEEGGNPVRMNRIFAAKDSVLCDSYAAALMGYSPQDIDYIAIAEKLGVGSSDLADAKIIELDHDKALTAATSSRKAASLARYCNEKMACSACYGSLIHALARLESKGALRNFEKKINIGQGFKGKCVEGIGIGNCADGCTKNVNGCPPTALRIYNFLCEEIKGYPIVY